MVATGLVASGLAGLWAIRMPIAQGLVSLLCSSQGLVCSARVVRLDFGGAGLGSLEVASHRDDPPVLSIDRLGFDLDWGGGAMAPRIAWIGVDGLDLDVDLSGGPVLGDLTPVVERWLARSGREGRSPRIRLSGARATLKTPLGPVETTGNAILSATGDYDGRFEIAGTRLEASPAQVDLLGGRMAVKGRGAVLDLEGEFQLDRVGAGDLKVEGLYGRLVVRRDGAAISATLSAVAETLSGGGLSLDSLRLEGRSEGAWSPSPVLSETQLKAAMATISLDGSAGEGRAGTLAWRNADLSLRLTSSGSSIGAGPLEVRMRDLSTPLAGAADASLSGQVEIAQGDAQRPPLAVRAEGDVSLHGLAATPFLRAQVDGAFASLGAPFSRDLAREASRTLVGVVSGGDLVSPWSLRFGGEELEAALTGPVILASSYPLSATLTRRETDPLVVRWTVQDGLSWEVSGRIETSGAGPHVDLLLEAEGDADGSLVGEIGGGLGSWRAGEDEFVAAVRNVRVSSSSDGGTASGEFEAGYSGRFLGGRVEGLRARGALAADWSGPEPVIRAGAPLQLTWARARFSDVGVGAGSVRVSPDGPLARRPLLGWRGSGRLEVAPIDVEVAGVAGVATLEDIHLDWRLDDGLTGRVEVNRPRLEFEDGETLDSLSARLISGGFRLGPSWSLDATLTDGTLGSRYAVASDVAGRLSLTGQGGDIVGEVRNVTGVVSDPAAMEDRLFEAVRVSADGRIENGSIAFSARSRLVSTDRELAVISGRHDFRSGQGSAHLPPTRLEFRPRGFQPSALSNRLRGPANVAGRVDLSGEVSWQGGDVVVSAIADLDALGFAIASAGVFEGVSGRVEVSDLLRMRSPPGQTIHIDKVTFGLPFENGDVRFQLLDAQTLRLEEAQFPFAQGAIRIEPMEYRFGADSNRIVARAERWSLTDLVRQFGVPDLEVEGVLSGVIPLSFTTGSARVEDAVLTSSEEGGVIRYTGQAGKSAGAADPNAELVFQALEDFSYRRLEVGLVGDITGRITLSLDLLGENPEVLGGADFDLRIGVESELMNLIQSLQSDRGLSSVIRSATDPVVSAPTPQH